jgi:hypothetical protein
MAFKMKGPRIFGKKNKVVSYDDKNEGTGTDYKKGVKTREKMITAKKAERQMARK